MKTNVEFRSDRFPAYDGEEKQVNPGLWGKRLAEFISEGLRTQGIETGYLCAEDWGWVVPIVNRDFSLWVGCGHQQDGPDAYVCFIHPHKPHIWRWFRKIDTAKRISEVHDALDKALSESAGIRDKRWYTEEEFMKGNH